MGTIDKATTRPWFYDSENGQVYSEKEGHEICGLNFRMDKAKGYDFCADEQQANAELIVRAVNMHDELISTLEEIAKGEGRYSQDNFEHARNTIEDIQKLATDMLAKAKGK